KRDFNWKIEKLDKTGLIASFYGPQFSCSNVKIPLLGRHQVFNAALAFAAAQYFLTCSEQLNEKTIRTGMETVKWPGRFQRIHKGKQEFILDGAHNPEAARTFVKTVSEHFGPDPVYLIFGTLNDKNISEMIKILSPVVSQVSIAGIQNKRSADPEKIYRLFCKDIDPERVKVFSNARDALKESPQKGKIFVAGSLFLVGEILEILNK
ncbi:MAG: cyanophycin synthetase, partial [Candidatus Theseobacter exili]|nr:cyanophycin synthetase [Candidatus Theseobacter exili]